MSDEPTVTENPAEHRFELTVDGSTAVLDYRRQGERLALVHTFVPTPIEGRGVGTRLVREVFEIARARGDRIVPHCAFVKDFVEKHPEYADVVIP